MLEIEVGPGVHLLDDGQVGAGLTQPREQSPPRDDEGGKQQLFEGHWLLGAQRRRTQRRTTSRRLADLGQPGRPLSVDSGHTLGRVERALPLETLLEPGGPGGCDGVGPRTAHQRVGERTLTRVVPGQLFLQQPRPGDNAGQIGVQQLFDAAETIGACPVVARPIARHP